jgi:uncharacterized protein YndB with AHSA1/START domain
MKFKFNTEINQPINKVIALFTDKNDLKNWQHELLSYESVNEIPDGVGAKTKYVHKSIIIFETILSLNLPGEIRGFYEHKAGKKTVMEHNTVYRFHKLSENKTAFELEMQEVKFVGLVPKIMAKLMGGMFERYHQNEVNQFKLFAEKQK